MRWRSALVFLVAAFLMAWASFAQATVTITGTLQGINTGGLNSGAFVRLTLTGCGGNQPRITGSSVLVNTIYNFGTDSSGNVKDNGATATVWGNDEIVCGGASGHPSYYLVQYFYNNSPSGPAAGYIFNASVGTYSLQTAIPVTVVPTNPPASVPAAQIVGQLTAANMPGGVVYTNTNNTYANGFTNDFSVTGGMTLPVGTGTGGGPAPVSPTANGQFVYDATTNHHQLSYGENGANKRIASVDRIQNQTYSYAADTGVADAYAINPKSNTAGTDVVTAYATGQRFAFKALNANATTTPTLNVHALGAKTIVGRGGLALLAGDIVAGQLVDVEYDGTNFQLQSLTGRVNSTTGLQINSAAPVGHVPIGDGANYVDGQVDISQVTGTAILPQIVGSYSNTGLSALIAATNLTASATNNLYLVQWVADTQATCTNATGSSLAFNIIFTDHNGTAHTVTTSGTGTTGVAGWTSSGVLGWNSISAGLNTMLPIWPQAGTAIQFSTTYGGCSTGGPWTYDIKVALIKYPTP